LLWVDMWLWGVGWFVASDGGCEGDKGQKREEEEVGKWEALEHVVWLLD
jgi:hypothetical protein